MTCDYCGHAIKSHEARQGDRRHCHECCRAMKPDCIHELTPKEDEG